MSNSREQLLKMEPLEVYKLLRKGEISQFPKGYFLQEDFVTKERCAKVMKYLFEDILEWDKKKLCENVSTYTFYDNGLCSMFNKVYNGSAWEVVEAVYPGEFKPWQFGRVPNNYWNEESVKEAIKWVIEEKMHWDYEDVCKNICQKTFFENNLRYPFLTFYNANLCRALNSVYPDKFKKIGTKIIIAA